MTRQRVGRRLAAVLVADMAGYSRLMGLDEETTHARMGAIEREILAPAIREHQGRIIKNTGDGMLAEFGSVVDAVRGAVQIQRRMPAANADVPDDRRIAFRIGINLGDIIAEQDDIYGDGVNVAARLEGLAEPGGLCISGQAHDQVRDKLPYPFADTGEQTVKNISRPIRVYALGAAAIAALPDFGSPAETRSPSRKRRRTGALAAAVGLVALIGVGAWLWPSVRSKAPSVGGVPSRFSLVVLPFANLSGDPSQDYLSDVLTEDLTTGLSRINGAFVIARSTAFTYKGKAVDVKQLGKDLGVRYVLEGSAQNSGSKVRVNAQLIDAETGAHLWADQFDADRSDLLEMQDQIVTRLSRALSIQLVDIDVARVKRTRPDNPDALDVAMQCLSGINRAADPVQLNAASRLCERALQMDSRNALALGLLAVVEIYPVLTSQSSDPAAAVRRADEYASRAMAVDPNSQDAHLTKAWVLMAQNRHEEAIVEAERTLELNPSFLAAYLVQGIANNFLGRPERAMELADKAIRLSPRDPLLWAVYQVRGEASFMLRKYDEAVEWIRRMFAMATHSDPYARLVLVSALALSEHDAEARQELKQYLSGGSTAITTIAQFRTQQLALAGNPAWLDYNERFFQGLRLAGMPE